MRKLLIFCFLTIELFSLDIDDIKTMREIGVTIAFPSESKAHAIPRGMKPREMMRVNYLNFNGVSLYYLPEWLPKMTNISRLELSDTKINVQELKKLKPLKNLDILNLSGNNLFKKSGNLVDVLSNFSLIHLNLSNTSGSSSDYTNIGSLSSLVKLDLSGNSISDIDGLNLENLKNLRVLKVANNSLSGTFYPSEIPQASLREFYLSGNSIKRFKFSGDFPSLEYLDISNNRQYMSFDEEYNNPFLFGNLTKNSKFNEDMVLPKSIINRLGIKVVESKLIDSKTNSVQADFSFGNMFENMQDDVTTSISEDIKASVASIKNKIVETSKSAERTVATENK